MRTGSKLLNCNYHSIFVNPGITLPRRYPLKREVESCNNRRLNALQGPEHTYCSVDSAGYDVHLEPIPDDSANQLLDRLIAVSKITLKVEVLAFHTLELIINCFSRLVHK
jgi:hypothetical protein